MLRTWGNSFSDAEAEAIPLVILDAKNAGVYQNEFYIDDSLDGRAPGSAVIPSGPRPKLVLDYRPMRTTLTAKINGLTAALEEFGPATRGSGVVSVNFVSGEVEFHADDAGKSVVFEYKHYGTVVDAHAFNRLQKAVLEGGAVQSVNGQTGEVVLGPSDVGASPLGHTHVVSQITDAGTAAKRNVAASGDAGAIEVVVGSDSRLTNPRAPTAHTHNASDINAGIVAAARGGTGVSTGLTQLNASNLNAGTVPDARLSSNVARRDAANTFAQPVTFNGGVVVAIKTLSNGTFDLLTTDCELNLNANNSDLKINLPSAAAIGQIYFGAVVNAGTYSITFDAGAGNNIHGPGSYGQTFVQGGPIGKSRWFRILKIASAQWLICTGA